MSTQLKSKNRWQKFELASGNGWLTSDGYSKYHERLTLSHNEIFNNHLDDGEEKKPELPVNEMVYGEEQALAHAVEYFQKEDEYTDSRRSKPLFLENTVSIKKTTHKIHWENGEVKVDKLKPELDQKQLKDLITISVYGSRHGDIIVAIHNNAIIKYCSSFEEFTELFEHPDSIFIFDSQRSDYQVKLWWEERKSN